MLQPCLLTEHKQSPSAKHMSRHSFKTPHQKTMCHFKTFIQQKQQMHIQLIQ